MRASSTHSPSPRSSRSSKPYIRSRTRMGPRSWPAASRTAWSSTKRSSPHMTSRACPTAIASPRHRSSSTRRPRCTTGQPSSSTSPSARYTSTTVSSRPSCTHPTPWPNSRLSIPTYAASRTLPRTSSTFSSASYASTPRALTFWAAATALTASWCFLALWAVSHSWQCRFRARCSRSWTRAAPVTGGAASRPSKRCCASATS